MSYQVFGKELADRMKTVSKSYRGIFEPTGATTQCERTGHGFKAGMPCYICGLPIPPKSSKGPSDELYPECEHILPLTQARWYLEIFMTTRPPGDKWAETAVQIEYDYAHRVCNQAKSMKSFVSPVGASIVADTDRIRDILNDIAARAQDNINAGDTRPLMAEIVKAVTAKGKGDRVGPILAVVKPIVDHVNSQPAMTDPGVEGLSTLVRATLLADPNALPDKLREIHDSWYQAKGPAHEAYKKVLQAFLQDATNTFPLISPHQFPAFLGARFARSGVDVTPYVTSDLIARVLETLYAGGVSLTSNFEFLRAFYYGVMQALYPIATGLVSRTNPAPTLLQCDLANALQTIVTEETRRKGSVSLSRSLFGPQPTVDPTLCNRRMSERTRAAPEVPEPPPPTPEEEATYTMTTLQAIVERRAKQFKVSELADVQSALGSVFDDLVEAYRSHPNDDDAALEDIEPELLASLRILFANRMKAASSLIDAIASDIARFRKTGEREGGKRHRTTRRRRKARKTLRKRIRA